jgi:hypothetical protein
MDTTTLKDEIRELERRIEELTASKPAHDTTGAHDMELLRLQDELDDKRDALARERDEDATAS